MSKLGALFESDGFGAGLAVGTGVALVLLGLVAVDAARSRRGPAAPSGVFGRDAPRARRRPPAVIGVGFVVGTVVAVDWFLRPGVPTIPVAGVAGLACLWIAGTTAAQLHDHRVLFGASLAVPGGLLLAVAAPHARAWVAMLLIVGPGVTGGLAAECDDHYGRSGLATLTFALALGGMYGTVPDTELTRVALGTAAPVVLLGWPFPFARLGGGAPAAVGLFLWIASVDGAARPGSIVGAAACLGVLVVEPVARWWASRDGAGTRSAPPAAVIVVQLVLVYVCSRIAGFQQEAAAAALLAVPALAVAGAVLAAIARTDRPTPPGGEVTSTPRGSPPGPRRKRRPRRSRRSRPVPPVLPDRRPPPRAR